MIEPSVLNRAVELQRRSYRLLRWAGEAVDGGRLEFETLHESASLPDAAFAWIDAHVTQLPADARPRLEDLRAFASDARERLLDDKELGEPIALGAYGRDLLRRVEGHSEGPAALALWRRFAWTATGAPRKDFTLSAEAILAAEARVQERLLGR